MLAGEALGAAVLGDARGAVVRWDGAWAAGMRPGQGARVPAPPRTERPEANRGSDRA
ncbi:MULTISPECIES: hypothetical protein [Sphingobium]|uniref:Uncharacterized protein n=1 Tax=Sphingobium yanoikuyae ATCC 51230 TaxID=883163 RepID=K9CZY2_SPHYA|nr:MULTISPECIES: hypothetical protein [Sphingobium]EKU76461.1 hypothetical protein HMPREF9718_00785 [Sphingobium yanoikuyae ATCC 51230]WQE05226.1 hypothetical protein U0025_12930 [Sphingobium yanoikuyae]SHL78637.1 hypothetical protein SAMN05518668_10383 [Sphingobium sp. YR657]